MYCRQCGSKNPDNVPFCSNCGAKLNEETQAPKVAPTVTVNTTTNYTVPEEYQPISAWGYVGYQLLFAVPCVGIIFLFIFAFGGTNKINLKNFARSYLCVMLIGFIISLITLIILALTGAFVSGFDYYY